MLTAKMFRAKLPRTKKSMHSGHVQLQERDLGPEGTGRPGRRCHKQWALPGVLTSWTCLRVFGGEVVTGCHLSFRKITMGWKERETRGL